MPINAQIALQGQPVQFDVATPLNLLQQGRQMQMQQEQLGMQRESHAQETQARNLVIQEKQREVTEGQRLREIFAASPDLRTALPEVFKVNPTVGIAMQKSLHEQEKAEIDLKKTQIETKSKQAERFGSIAGTITDEPTFHQGIVTALNEGLIKPADAQQLLSAGWSPEAQAFVKQIKEGALSAKEQHDAGLADLENQRKAATEKHEAEMRPYQVQKAQADASDAYRDSDAVALAAAAKQGPQALAFSLQKLADESPARYQKFASLDWRSKPEDILRLGMKSDQAQRAGAADIDRVNEERHRRETERHQVAMEARLDKLNAAGLSQAQSQRVMQIANQFDNEAIVKNYNVITEGVSFAKSLGEGAAANAGDDQALLYAFAKVMDPNSVVREGEYATVQKYSQSWAQQFGFKAERVFSNSPFLTDEARKLMKATMEKKAQASRTNYDNVYNEYGRRIETQAGVKGGKDYLTNYGQAFDQPAAGGAVPSAVSQALANFSPGIHTLSDGSKWMKAADGTITKQ